MCAICGVASGCLSVLEELFILQNFVDRGTGCWEAGWAVLSQLLGFSVSRGSCVSGCLSLLEELSNSRKLC